MLRHSQERTRCRRGFPERVLRLYMSSPLHLQIWTCCGRPLQKKGSQTSSLNNCPLKKNRPLSGWFPQGIPGNPFHLHLGNYFEIPNLMWLSLDICPGILLRIRLRPLQSSLENGYPGNSMRAPQNSVSRGESGNKSRDPRKHAAKTLGTSYRKSWKHPEGNHRNTAPGPTECVAGTSRIMRRGFPECLVQIWTQIRLDQLHYLMIVK